MKKYIFLLPIMLFAHDVMFGMKKQKSSFKKEKKTNVFQIADDAERCYNIFHNFMKISESGEKKIKLNKNAAVPFKNIWELCLDENNQINQKKQCKAKSVLHDFIYNKIEELKDVFESKMIKRLNKKVGKNKYTKNILFSENGFKTKSFINYMIADENLQFGNDVALEEAKIIFKNVEEAYKKICEYQTNIEELYKESGNDNEDSDDELNTEIFEMDLNYDDCSIKKEQKSSFRKKIKTEIINIFNDENRIENTFLEIKNNAKNIAPQKTVKQKKSKKIKKGSYKATFISGYNLSLNHFENLNNTSEIKHTNSIKHSESIVEDVFSDDILSGISGVKEIESYEKKNKIIKK